MTGLRADVERRVISVLAAIVRRTEVDLNATWRELGLDSLDLLELVTCAEDEFGLAIPDRTMLRLRSPLELVGHVAAQLSPSGRVFDEGDHPLERPIVVRALGKLENGQVHR